MIMMVKKKMKQTPRKRGRKKKKTLNLTLKNPNLSDGCRPDKRVDRLLSLIGSELPAGQTRVVGLNKVDLVKDKRRLLSLAAQMEGLMAFDQ